MKSLSSSSTSAGGITGRGTDCSVARRASTCGWYAMNRSLVRRARVARHDELPEGRRAGRICNEVTRVPRRCRCRRCGGASCRRPRPRPRPCARRRHRNGSGLPAASGSVCGCARGCTSGNSRPHVPAPWRAGPGASGANGSRPRRNSRALAAGTATASKCGVGASARARSSFSAPSTLIRRSDVLPS